MNKGLLVGVIIGAVGVTAAGSVASLHYMDQQPQYAEVVSTKAVMAETMVPVEECKTVQVQVQKPVKDEHQISGTAIGAVVGGVLGNQVGGGDGKKVATVIGAVAGGYTGKQVQKEMQTSDVENQAKQTCTTVQKKKSTLVGYDVRYLLDGKLKTIRMSEKPGEQLLIQNDQVLPVAKADAVVSK
ncbi:MAG: glycine zipper 2TM domain-containing protein [Gammaproteobacteria bacterium]|jgi:uncharacterized protein YcfJ|nr:glycine zipper 2TM domain-containing protein [Gammaproteobacteria bacterium]